MSRVIGAEGAPVVDDAPQSRLAHALDVAIAAVEERQRPAQRPALRVERQVDQDVIIEVHAAVQIEIAVEPSAQMIVSTYFVERLPLVPT